MSEPMDGYYVKITRPGREPINVFIPRRARRMTPKEARWLGKRITAAAVALVEDQGDPS